MGLISRLAGAIWRRMESLPGARDEIDRQKRMVQILIEAERAAYSSFEDSNAKAILAERLDADPNSIDRALTMLAGRSEYISDRARRLLSAVDSDSPVAPMPQDCAELFSQEEALGKMPLKRAFRRLVELEPRLMNLERQVNNIQITKGDRASGLPSKINETLVDLVGVGASGDDALVRTNLAASIVRQYFEILSGTTILGNIDTPYFDAPLKIGIRVSRT